MRGWIKHDGGNCPVNEGDIIDVRYRDGGEHEAVTVTVVGAMNTVWCHTGTTNDIMEYRIQEAGK